MSNENHIVEKSTNIIHITKRITGSDFEFTGESRYIKGDYSYHSIIYESELFKLEILGW
jgi:hypothetical protein